MSKKTELIELKPIEKKYVTVFIEGDTDLVLNKMDDVTARTLTDERKDKAKTTEKPNLWEKIITSLHWRDGKPSDFSEDGLAEALKTNAPCITSFGLCKSFGEALTRNKIDTYSTSFDASVNIIAPGGLIPIEFTEHHIVEKLMTPKKGAPVLAYLHYFSGWRAQFEIQYLENVYSSEQIVNIINLAGFGIGIGTGRRSCKNGRYHVVNVA